MTGEQLEKAMILHTKGRYKWERRNEAETIERNGTPFGGYGIKDTQVYHGNAVLLFGDVKQIRGDLRAEEIKISEAETFVER